MMVRDLPINTKKNAADVILLVFNNGIFLYKWKLGFFPPWTENIVVWF